MPNDSTPSSRRSDWKRSRLSRFSAANATSPGVPVMCGTLPRFEPRAPSADRDGAGVALERRMRAVAVEARLDAPLADAALRVLARADRVAPAALGVGLDDALERLPEAARRRVPDDDAGACARGLDGAAGGHGLVGRMRRAGTA